MSRIGQTVIPLLSCQKSDSLDYTRDHYPPNHMCVCAFHCKITNKTHAYAILSSLLHISRCCEQHTKNSSLTDSQRKFCPEMRHFMHVDMRDGACIPRTQSSCLTLPPSPNTSLSQKIDRWTRLDEYNQICIVVTMSNMLRCERVCVYTKNSMS